MIAWLRRLSQSRFHISSQIYLGLGAAVAFTVAASAIGFVSFDQVGGVQRRVNEDVVPALAAAFRLANQSSVMADDAPLLMAAPTPQALEEVSRRVERDRRDFKVRLAELTELTERSGATLPAEISAGGAALTANLEQIERMVRQGFVLAAKRREMRAELFRLHEWLTAALVPALDDQLFYTMTGYRELGAPPDPRVRHATPEAFDHYRHLAGIRDGAAIGQQVLATVFTLGDAALLEPLRERFEAASHGIRRHLQALPPTPLNERLTPLAARLISLGNRAGGAFDLRSQELALKASEAELLEENHRLTAELVAVTTGLVGAAQAHADAATRASAEAIRTGQNLLIVLIIVSTAGAVLIGWLYVGRVLVSRLELLAARMHAMAKGDLEGEVEVRGRDEVADMAAALEVFRRHALEVQRLNLVEKLADELKGKNEELEGALKSLEQAQDQVVMQEKLAALGELTAGVAHEIKNPLNFIKNFSESSQELLEELREEIAKERAPEAAADDDETPEERRELIDELSADLVGNLEKIHAHGERANSVVQSMLQMGRGEAERRMTDINHLLDEHARLAFHSARASDTEFTLDIQQELDPEIGELEVIPNDLGRVFLNMITNACYATDEKRRRLAEEGGADYTPTLQLATRNHPDRVEIRIRDNGSGIPDELKEKVFNPFFTTKPTDKGTGLGLALSSDIVREHGGAIRVESEAGEFTEMIVSLPRPAGGPEGAHGGA